MPSAQPELDATTEEQFLASVGPQLRQLASRRQALRGATLRYGGALLAAGLLGAIVLLLVFRGRPELAHLAVPALAAGVVGAIWIGVRNQRRWGSEAHSTLLPAACEVLPGGLDYTAEAPVDDILKPFEALNLVGHSNRRKVNHRLTGEYRDRQFEVAHANLRRKSGGGKNSTTTTVFQGLLLRIQTRQRVEAGITVGPKAGAIMQLFSGASVPTGNDAFDEAFQVQLDPDTDESRREMGQVLDAPMQDALLAVADSEGRAADNRPTFQAGFKYDSLYIALSRTETAPLIGPLKTERPRPFLRPGLHLRAEVDLEQAAVDMLRDIHTIHRIIDRLPDGAAARED